MFWKRKQHIRNIEDKEKEIERSKKRLDKSMDADIKKLDTLNKILKNGITLEIARGMGNRHV